MTGHPLNTFESLPSELLIHLLSHLSELEDIVAISQTCSKLRHLCSTESRIWIKVLYTAAVGAGVTIDEAELSHTRVAEPRADFLYNFLSSAATSDRIPARAWIPILPSLSRNFLLYYFDFPSSTRLSSTQWRELVVKRFHPSLVRGEDLRLGDGGRRPQGRNRALFIKCLEKLEHKEITACAQQEHLIRYIVLHRSFGLTLNRISSREYDPVSVFDELKKQNSLTEHTTVQIPISRHLCPKDLNVSVLIVVGRSDFRKNLVAQEVLHKLNKWQPRADFSHSVLGPVLITASVRASPDAPPLRRAWDQPVYSSFDLEDFFQVCDAANAGLTREWFESKCVIKEGVTHITADNIGSIGQRNIP